MEEALKSVLAWWDAARVDVPEVKPVKRRRPAPPEQERAQIAAPNTQDTPAVTTTSTTAKSARDVAQSAETLQALRGVIDSFDAGEISDHARQAVFSRGNPEADIMVIGEAPGRDEDIAGKPFVGRSGQLLDKIFASIGLTEDMLYITNVVNWRPPNNRNPKPEEIELCKPLLTRHIELIDPKFIVLVGGISLSAMTDRTGIMKNRGQWISLEINGREIPTLPIYHPAFLLRQPALKRDAWRDMLSLRARLEDI